MSTPITELSLEKRLELVDDLWDNIAAEPERLPLAPEQCAELDDRLDEFEPDGDLGLPAGDVVAQLRRALIGSGACSPLAKKRSVPNKLKPWIEARKRFGLSHAHVQMTRGLGMNPKKLASLANHRQ